MLGVIIHFIYEKTWKGSILANLPTTITTLFNNPDYISNYELNKFYWVNKYLNEFLKIIKVLIAAHFSSNQ